MQPIDKMHNCLTRKYVVLFLLYIYELDINRSFANDLINLPTQFQRRGLNADQSYSHRKVNIRMTKLSGPSMESRAVAEQNPMHTNQSMHEEVSFNVGGLGLASSTHNRISLGSLSSAVVQAVGKDTRDREGQSLSDTTQHKQPPKVEAVTPVWPTQTPTSDDLSDINVRIMGQPIDPKVVNHLHPDVSPWKVRKLRKILAGSLDKEWTSETAPRILRQRGISGSIGKSVEGSVAQPDLRLINEAHSLNFTFRHEVGNYFTLPESQLAAFRNWLIDKATCEMDYIWEDLGPLFWPRWIRRGVCINRQGHSCSWPPGMKCRPSGSRALQLLHWKCEDAAYIQSRKHAAEQRNRRRATGNMFQSNFYDMKPDVPEPGNVSPNDRSGLSRLSLRDTHGSIISLAAHSQARVRLHSRSIPWATVEPWEKKTQKSESDIHISRDEHRKRRVRRLIKRLSVKADGYHCYWQVQKYLISDRCACLCS
ncbi:uncharacterized protein DEA37_0000091 [Paragonimus westermani]|uniref:Noggin n=1 Tax=Paragonimus westermani TaxID=34504 RepID=A0A5J4P2F3_9TREM|nr:uncharacterized protein DEA37_0000091 [Paragonimus westermani]